MPPLSPFRDDAVGTKHHQVLGDPGMANAEPVLQRFHVAFASPQLLNDPNALRVPKHSQECGKLPGNEKLVRHGWSPSSSKIQTLEYNVWAGHPVGKVRAAADLGRGIEASRWEPRLPGNLHFGVGRFRCGERGRRVQDLSVFSPDTERTVESRRTHLGQ